MSTNDHSQLINRNEPNQHMAKSIVYAGKALNEQLDTMKAGIAERPTTAQVADSYYDKNEIDTQLSAMGGTDHSQLLNRDEPNQHLAKAISYNGAPLNAQLNTMKADIADRVTATQVADGYYGKSEIDAQMAAKAGTDHAALDNRDAADQHPAEAITYNGAALTVELDAVRASVAERPTAAEVADGYYDKSEIDAQLAGKAGTNHAALDNRDAADQHPAAAISYNGAALDTELDAVRADVATKVTASDVAANHYTKAEADAHLAGKSGIYDATCVTTGTRHDLTIPAFPALSPATFTVRVTMDADYRSGNTFHIGGTEYAARTQTNDPAPDDVVKSGATIEIVFDANRGLAFFRGGVGAKANGWNISVGGETPVTEGIHVPDAVRPSRVYLDNSFKLHSSHIKQVSCGFCHTLILLETGKVLSCGYNEKGQLGRTGKSGSEAQVNLEYNKDLEGITALSAGVYNSLFVRSDGQVFSCGISGWNNRTYPGSESSSNLGVIPNLTDVIQVALGYDFALFLLKDGRIMSVGANMYGQLGRNVKSSNRNLGIIPNLEGITSIAAGHYHSLFLQNTGVVYSCGLSLYGQLGNTKVGYGNETSINLGRIPDLNSIKAIAACGQGCHHSLLLHEDGTVWSCGQNSYGELGRAGNSEYMMGKIPELTDVVSIAAGNGNSLFLRSDGKVLSCGSNKYGVLGRPTVSGSSTKSNLGIIQDLDDVVAINTGWYTSSFIRANGSVYFCGSNGAGEQARSVLTGSETRVNLGRSDHPFLTTGTPDPSPYGEGALLVRHIGVDSDRRVCIYNDGFFECFASPVNVFQIDNNRVVEKRFQINRTNR